MSITDVCKKQLFLCFQMVDNLINITPGDIWNKKLGGFVFWQQIAHSIITVHFWFRNENEEFQEPYSELKINPQLDKEPENDLSKEQVMDLLTESRKKATVFFEKISDEKLTEKSYVFDKATHIEVIFENIRHLQYHIGHCESLLRENGITNLEWLYDFGE